MLLFGSIAVVGLNTLIKSQVDMSKARNLCIVSLVQVLVLVIGIGGMKPGTDTLQYARGWFGGIGGHYPESDFAV